MDAFYASIEQMDNPQFRGKPVVVGQGVRGVVSAASYEARAFGIRSAMPLGEARQRCPNAIFTPGRMERYKEVSKLVQKALTTFSPLVEQASIDEAYLDATGLERLFGPVESLAQKVRQAVATATNGLSCSVGVAPIKFLAKIASDMHKPGGITIITSEQMPEFLRNLPVERIPGVGKQFLSKLKPLCVHTAGDVRNFSMTFWEQHFGKAGIQLYERAQGHDLREVLPLTAPKSESSEHTFNEDTADIEVLKTWLFRQSERVGRSLRRQSLKGRVITVKLKYFDFKQVTRRVTLSSPTSATQTIYETACALLESQELVAKVRLVGVGVSGFGEESRQLLLPMAPPARAHPKKAQGDAADAVLAPPPHEREQQREKLDATLDTLRERFGSGAIVAGKLFPMAPKEE